MIVIIDEREIVKDGFESGFGREGVSTAGFCPMDFGEWVGAVEKNDIDSIEAFLIGQCEDRESITEKIRKRSEAAVIAMNDGKALEETLRLFGAGVDDVVGKPIHVRELLARIAAIGRRRSTETEASQQKDIVIYTDGRDPLIGGEPMCLPRRERRILDYLFANRERRVTKSQIFNNVYGLFNQDVDDNVIESHISKLRKRIRAKIGYDPIDSKRHLGYRLVTM